MALFIPLFEFKNKGSEPHTVRVFHIYLSCALSFRDTQCIPTAVLILRWVGAVHTTAALALAALLSWVVAFLQSWWSEKEAVRSKATVPVAVAWFDGDQYARFLENAADRASLWPTF